MEHTIKRKDGTAIKIVCFSKESLDKLPNVVNSPRKRRSFWERFINGILTV